MKTRSLQNYDSSVGVEVYDIDWNCKEELLELGRLCASQCIVFLDENIPTKTLYDCMSSWGDPSMALMHEQVTEKKVTGRHWRELYAHLMYITKAYAKDDMYKATSVISYKQEETGKPLGMFVNGELDWHSDQCAFDDCQRIIALQSISNTENSQTQFLCTHDAYESLSSDMQSMVRELVVKHKWIDEVMAPGLDETQAILLRYNMVPLDGMETSLYSETASGLSGMKIPSCTFDGFVGMSRNESDRIMNELKSKIYNQNYVYTQNWKDGQAVFMDQEITLHKRPTYLTTENKRSVARSIFHVNNLFDTKKSKRTTTIRYQRSSYNIEDFMKLVDEDRKKTYDGKKLV